MLLLTLASTALAIPVPTSSFPNDPDRGWKRGLYDVLVSLDNPTNFDLGYPLPLIDNPSALYGYPGNGGFSQIAQDEYLQHWLMESSAAPYVEYLWSPPEQFTLSYIEGVTTWPAHNVDTTFSLVQPLTQEDLAGYGFLYHWDYSGNPFHGDPAVLNRAMSVLALELIGLDQLHKVEDNSIVANHVLGTPITATETGCQDQPPRASLVWGNDANTSYDFALALEDLAYTWWRIREDVPDWTRSYYDEAFIRLGDRLACWTPSVLHYNRVTPGMLALLLIADATGSWLAWDDYETYTADVLAMFDAAGYFPDDYGWDSSYNNINVGNLGRLAMMDDALGPSAHNANIHAALDRMYRMKRYLTIVEPYAQPAHHRYAPNQWNTRTGGDLVTGQGLRDLSPFEAINLGVQDAYSELQDWEPTSPEDFAYMGTTSTISAFGAEYRSAFAFGRLDPQYTTMDDWNAAPYPLARAWSSQPSNYYWPNYAVTMWDHNRDYLADWANALASNPDLDLFANQIPGDTCELLDDDFVYVQQNGMSALVHVGPVSVYEAGAQVTPETSYLPAGFGGGMLAYLYDADGGASILSRRRNRYPSQNPLIAPESAEDWSRWDSWALHDVWVHRVIGTGESVTHSGRIVSPQVSVSGCSPGSASATITVSGDIPDTNTWPFLNCPSGDLGCVDFSAPIPYQRTFGFGGGPVHVETRVGPTVDVVDAVYETIPLNGLSYLNYGDTSGWTPTSTWHWEDAAPVEFDTIGGTFVASATPGQWYDDVLSVRYTRLGRGIRMDFVTPQRVKLNDFYGFWYNYDPNAPVDGDGSNTWLRTRNLVIDVMQNALGPGYAPQQLPATAVAYSIDLL